MKKFIVYLMVFALSTGLASMSFGRTMAEEMTAVRDYLNVVDAKLATAKQAKDTARVALLHKEKAATLLRWEKLKATMETPKPPVIIRTPAPPPVVIRIPAPPPVIVTVPNTKEVGRGVDLYFNGGFNAGLVGFSGNFDYDLSGLPAQGLKMRVGANYITGTNPSGGDEMQAIFAKLGAVYYISPFLPELGMPLTWYLGGAYLIPVKVNDSRTGVWGLEGCVGANYNVPEMGVVNFEMGYGVLKYSADQAALKGVDLKIGYGITF
ncbi:hypothetical protein A2291_01910 [candidate division WOR-1 bacterium RIFOXYB2_FULL_42_35]|uniref:Outer membrane protein beta-barrel domain-containing protein n=1 Tax=candidate division WOR-1 bacterium RIFOXYC2_FULL_41_25 TaxID=1802586 RepID=A0A1F4TPR7_UNCSA|nr:MAG: hypothetical protein A2247_03710 [candidate division WOR-1 bacterium RIFOXYA2_FULL_41_14]OGC25158.1 MAG: hypothetical protein A2291_01910 [candidate division WOR-1 bacterium RIFOXYB2_FULL_42_35]OGC34714.1 MAG: hypothetical protein A2462_03225 [candidate division WOR-1 bacterium RIFOXYC2_FULL_41_25]